MRQSRKKSIKTNANRKGKAGNEWGVKGCLLVAIAGLITIIVIGIMSCLRFYEGRF